MGEGLEEAERPRERLLRMGAAALADPELLAVLLGGGARGGSMLTVAQGLLGAGGGLKAFCSRDAHELCTLRGLGPTRAAQVLAALELGRRALRSTERRPRLHTPEQLFRHLRPTLGLQRRESFHVLCFNPRNVLLHETRVAEGSVNACPVDPREVFAAALLCRASAIAVAHNHPSGDPEPSSLDLLLTRQLAAGARLLGLRLLDHLVVGDNSFVSLRERGMLPSDEPGSAITLHAAGP